jgi:hypothetical protein
MLGAVGALILASLSPESTQPKQNEAADAVVQYGVALGIDFNSGDPEAAHPNAADAESYLQAKISAWLKSQIEHESDEITEPPANLRRYLDDHSIPLWSLVLALQRQSPDWGELVEGDLPVRISGPTQMLERILIVTVLIEEHDGNWINADRALEASWSLGRPVAATPTLWSQSRASDIQKLQSGVLRKLKAPTPQWLSRFAGRSSWEGVLDALPNSFRRTDGASGSETPWDDVSVRSLRAVAEAVRRASPCGLAAMSDDDLWTAAEVEFSTRESDDRRAALSDLRGNGLPLVASILRRAARAEVDREMTLKVLQLRFERQASAQGSWPAKLPEPASAVCPGEFYSYRGDKSAIVLRFEGPIDRPATTPTLPLCFRSRAGEPPMNPESAP